MGITTRLKSAMLERQARRQSVVSIAAGGHQMHFATTHPVSKQWFYPRYMDGSQHEPNVTDLFCREVGEGDVVFDVGANQGYFSVLSALLSGSGQVHAFELDPTLIPLIQASASLNSGICPIAINQAAVSDTVGDYVSFAPHIDGNLTTNSIIYARQGADISVCSSTVTLDHYSRSRQVDPDFIKMDVEGAEFEAISGMQEMLGRARPKLLIEIHPRQLREGGRTCAEVIELIMAPVPDYTVKLVDDYRDSSNNYLVEYVPAEHETGERPFVLFFKV